MLEDPFFYSNIRKCWKHYNVKTVDARIATMSLTNIPKSPSAMYTPTRLEMCPHSGIIITPNEKEYLKGKYDKLKFGNGKVVFYNVPPVIVTEKATVELNFISDEDLDKIQGIYLILIKSYLTISKYSRTATTRKGIINTSRQTLSELEKS